MEHLLGWRPPPAPGGGAERLLAHLHARFCVQSYFGELSHRFDGGFDPARSISAGDQELTHRPACCWSPPSVVSRSGVGR